MTAFRRGPTAWVSASRCAQAFGTRWRRVLRQSERGVEYGNVATIWPQRSHGGWIAAQLSPNFLGAALWRYGIHRVLGGFVEDGDWSEADAMRVVDLVAHNNAARIYRLGER
jgi:hypothetical protein